ncbi:uncharacterized protein LOC111301981 [Durio zibethinus]|uniref:Uncharacterized protein LOC111301981 n=1 Tax=Durio zibethinus TaxID=66656 RepID=A0A6P5ZLH6_DURZI|nr:uncharacterized protein LOC111301981 [Durio zibethinus]
MVEPVVLELKSLPFHLRWSIVDIGGINPTFCIHKILMEDGYRPTIELHGYLYLAMKERGMTVMPNENDEMIPTKTAIGWHHSTEDQEKISFTYPFGTLAFGIIPFGLCNALATFYRCMMVIFSDMVEDFLEVFMDDFSILGDSFDMCLANLPLVFKHRTHFHASHAYNHAKRTFDPTKQIIILPLLSQEENTWHKDSTSSITFGQSKSKELSYIPSTMVTRGIQQR